MHRSQAFSRNCDQRFVDFHGSIVRPHSLGVLERLWPRSVEEAENKWLITTVFRERLSQALTKILSIWRLSRIHRSWFCILHSITPENSCKVGTIVRNAVAIPEKILDLLWCPRLTVFEEFKEFVKLFRESFAGRPPAKLGRSPSIPPSFQALSQRPPVGWDAPTRRAAILSVSPKETFLMKQSRRTRRVSSAFWASLIASSSCCSDKCSTISVRRTLFIRAYRRPGDTNIAPTTLASTRSLSLTLLTPISTASGT